MSGYTRLSSWYTPEPRVGKYQTSKLVHWEIGRPGSGAWLTVSEKYTFDVSIPALFTFAFDSHEPRFMKAACLHDWMLDQGWDRTTAAGVFNDALRADGVSRVKRMAMFTAVAWFKWK